MGRSRTPIALLLVIGLVSAGASHSHRAAAEQPAPSGRAAQGVSPKTDPVEVAISEWSARREKTWLKAQDQKSRIPKDSKWPGQIGAEANQSIGFVDGADEVISKLRKIRDIGDAAQRSKALQSLADDLARRRAQFWQEVQEKKRSVNREFPDRFGAEINQLIGRVDALDAGLKSVAELGTAGASAVLAQGEFAGPLSLRSQLSVTKGTLKLSIKGQRVSGTINAASRHSDGSKVSQTATLAGTISPEGKIIATVTGASKYVPADPDKPFSYLPGAIYNYSFAGTLSGTSDAGGASGTLKMQGQGGKSKDVTLTSDWKVSPVR